MSGETIKVRIMVAVNERGEYSASGYDGSTEGGLRESIDYGGSFECEDTEASVYHIVVAELPVPKGVTVKGEVKP